MSIMSPGEENARYLFHLRKEILEKIVDEGSGGWTRYCEISIWIDALEQIVQGGDIEIECDILALRKRLNGNEDVHVLVSDIVSIAQNILTGPYASW